MADTISILSEIRSSYNCFDEEEEPYYRALTKGIEAIKVAQQEIDYWRDKCKMYEQAVEMASAELPDTNVGDIISRQAAIDALDVLCEEHRYRIPGKRETYSEYNEAWQDALDRAQGVIFNLPSAERKGHWKHHLEIYGMKYECTICKSCYELPYSYCPSCGARMERE